MAIYDFNKPGGLLNLNPNDTGSLGINISPINEQKKLEEEERARAEKSMKLKNFADTLRMVNANQSGNSQQSMMFANRLAQRKADQEARQLKAQKDLEARTLKEQQDMRRRDYFGGNQNLLQFAEIMGDEAAYAEKLRLDALENQRIKNQNFNSVAQGIKRTDYDSNREYYQALGMGYLNKGYNEEARNFLEMGKARTSEDLGADIRSERKEVAKNYKPINEAVVGYRKLQDALMQKSGTAAYTSLVLFMKNLDGSVVKEGEVAAFGRAQGLLGNLEKQIKETKGEGMTDAMRKDILNLAKSSTKHMLNGYDDYMDGTKTTYEFLNLPHDIIFSGYEINRDGLDFTQIDSFTFDKKITGTIVE